MKPKYKLLTKVRIPGIDVDLVITNIKTFWFSEASYNMTYEESDGTLRVMRGYPESTLQPISMAPLKVRL